MSDQLHTIFKTLIEAIGHVGPFPYDYYVNRLHNKARIEFEAGHSDPVLRSYIEEVGGDATREPRGMNNYIDIFHVPDLIYKLAAPTACSALASVDEKYDPHHLKRYASQVSRLTVLKD